MNKKKILIVEDEFIVANDLRLTLEKESYEVAGIAASFKEACDMIQSQEPDLVLLDIRLKGKQTGIELAEHLRKKSIAFFFQIQGNNHFKMRILHYRFKNYLMMHGIPFFEIQHRNKVLRAAVGFI